MDPKKGKAKDSKWVPKAKIRMGVLLDKSVERLRSRASPSERINKS